MISIKLKKTSILDRRKSRQVTSRTIITPILMGYSPELVNLLAESSYASKRHKSQEGPKQPKKAQTFDHPPLSEKDSSDIAALRQNIGSLLTNSNSETVQQPWT